MDVIGEFILHVGRAVEGRIDRREITVKAVKHIFTDAITTDVADIHCHRVMVIVDREARIKARLFLGFIVFGEELTARDGGSLKVDVERELKVVIEVRLSAAVFAVIKVSFQTDEILRIILQPLLCRVKLNVDVRGIDRTAVAVGLADVVLYPSEHFFARSGIGDGDDHLICTAEHASPDETERVYRSFLVRDRDKVSVCRNDLGRRVLLEVVRAEVTDVVSLNAADRTGGVSIGKRLVEKFDRIVEFVGIGFKVINVKERSTRPIAVEGKIRNRKIDFIFGIRVKNDKSFHVHTVFKRSVKVFLVLCGKRDLHRHVKRCARRDRNGLARNAVCRHRRRCARKKIGFFGHRGLTVVRFGLTDTLSHNEGGNIVGDRFRTEILYREAKFVNARLIGIVAEFDLRLIHKVARHSVTGEDIRIRFCRFRKTCKTCALFTDCIGKTVGVPDNIRRRHQKAVDDRRHLSVVIRRSVGIFGETRHHVFAEKRNDTRHIRRCHRRTRNAIVILPRHCGKNVTAVRRDLGLDAKVGRRAPRGEVRHKRT